MTDSEEIQKILRDCLRMLNCPLGKFYPDKNYGSSLHGLSNKTDAADILYRARRALLGIDGVFVSSVSFLDNGVSFTVLINNSEERQVEISL